MKLVKDFIAANHWNHRSGHKPIAIVNHITEGSVQSARNWFKNPASQVSSHFIVAKDGTVYYMVPITETTWCNGGIEYPADKQTKVIRDNPRINPNYYTVSIEHEGVWSERKGGLTEPQLKATIELHKWIISEVKKAYGVTIPADRDHILGHMDISPRSRPNCPGQNFPFDAIIRALTDESKPEAKIPIMASPTVTVAQMQTWARNHQATQLFIDLAPTYYNLSVSKGVNPAVSYALSAHETAYGRFGGVLDASYKNPCGMKTAQGGADNDASAHQRFKTWDQGIMALVDHLALYAGHLQNPTPDPRHAKWIQGRATTVEDLGGNWAPSASYGERVAEKVKAMQETNVSDSSSITWHSYPPGYYKALEDLSIYHQPYSSKTLGRRGVIPKGVIFLARTEIRKNVTGVQLRLADGCYVLAQLDNKVFVEAYKA